MTCGYAFYFVAVASTIVLCVPAALSVILVAALVDMEVWARVLLASSSLPMILFVWYMQNHKRRVQLRAAVWPAWCNTTDLVITSKNKSEKDVVQEVAAFCKEKQLQYGRPPQPVGGGWGFWLKRAGPDGPRLFLYELKGKVREKDKKDSRDKWYAGTTIAAVNAELLRYGQTLTAVPTMQYISIGSWFAQGNHGNNSYTHPGSEAIFKEATVMDMRTSETKPVSTYKELREKFDGEEAGAYVVLTVTIDVKSGVVQNDYVQKRGIVIDSPSAAAAYLLPGAKLMLVFVGSARRHAVGLRWDLPYDSKRTHRDPHDCSVSCQFLQADLCSLYCGCIESMRNFTGTSTLANANTWVPHLTALEEMTVVLLGWINFEIIFNLGGQLSGITLFRLTSSLSAMHYQHGGRSELRVSSFNTSIVYVDVSLRKKSFSAPFAMLSSVFGTKEVALHNGKFTQISTAPCKRVSLHTVLLGGHNNVA